MSGGGIFFSIEYAIEMDTRLAILAASTPGQRAGNVGSVVLHILALLAVVTVCIVIIGLIVGCFALVWKYVPWLLILWGLSGIVVLISR